MTGLRWNERAIDVLRTAYPRCGGKSVAKLMGELFGYEPMAGTVTDHASIYGVRRDGAGKPRTELSSTRWPTPKEGRKWRRLPELRGAHPGEQLLLPELRGASPYPMPSAHASK